jgi:hypothetical protein
MERKTEIAVGGTHLLFLFRSIDPHNSICKLLVRLILHSAYSTTTTTSACTLSVPNQ